MRKLRTFVVYLVLVYVALLGGLFFVMRQPILFGSVMRHVPEPLMMLVPFKRLWFAARAGRLHVGDVAPDFNLPTADKHSRIELASFRKQKLVVLVFGSYT